MTTIDGFLGIATDAASFRQKSTAKTLESDFMRRLGAKVDPDEIVKRALHDFLIDVVIPVRWYSDKIKIAFRYRNWYIAACAILIVLIPVIVIVVPPIATSSTAGLGDAAKTILGQFSVILMGILALQRTAAGLLNQQQRYGAWYKASSELKKIWYGFETQWYGVDLVGKKDEFVKDLRVRREQGRAILAEEESDYFTKLTLPSIDVLDVLTKSRPDLAAMAAPMLPDATRVTELRKATQDLARNAALISGLDEEIKKRTAEAAQEGDETKKKAILEPVAALQKSLDDARRESITLKAEVAAKSMS